MGNKAIAAHEEVDTFVKKGFRSSEPAVTKFKAVKTVRCVILPAQHTVIVMRLMRPPIILY